MARRHQHEEHQNHEAWAVPYGDLVTLLLAFFVVMYAISSVNEGKYRAVSDALSSAFGGPPRSISPIQLGQTQLRGSSFDRPSLLTPATKTGPTSTSPVSTVRVRQMLDMPTGGACLEVRRWTWQSRAPVTYVRQLFPGGRYHLMAEFTPGA